MKMVDFIEILKVARKEKKSVFLDSPDSLFTLAKHITKISESKSSVFIYFGNSSFCLYNWESLGDVEKEEKIAYTVYSFDTHENKKVYMEVYE